MISLCDASLIAMYHLPVSDTALWWYSGFSKSHRDLLVVVSCQTSSRSPLNLRHETGNTLKSGLIMWQRFEMSLELFIRHILEILHGKT